MLDTKIVHQNLHSFKIIEPIKARTFDNISSKDVKNVIQKTVMGVHDLISGIRRQTEKKYIRVDSQTQRYTENKTFFTYVFREDDKEIKISARGHYPHMELIGEWFGYLLDENGNRL